VHDTRISQPPHDVSPGAAQLTADGGPLQRRLMAQQPAPAWSLNALPAPAARHSPALAEQDAGYATLGMLDGTVIARLQCHETMGIAVLGRSSSVTVRIADPFVHRVHCELFWDPAFRAHVIRHGDGSNGTWVNLERIIQPVRLVDGARIRVGKTELIYRRAYYPGS
jgi:hypothetical protein